MLPGYCNPQNFLQRLFYLQNKEGVSFAQNYLNAIQPFYAQNCLLIHKNQIWHCVSFQGSGGGGQCDQMME